MLFDPPFLTNELRIVYHLVQEIFGIFFIVVTLPQFVQTKKQNPPQQADSSVSLLVRNLINRLPV